MSEYNLSNIERDETKQRFKEYLAVNHPNAAKKDLAALWQQYSADPRKNDERTAFKSYIYDSYGHDVDTAYLKQIYQQYKWNSSAMASGQKAIKFRDPTFDPSQWQDTDTVRGIIDWRNSYGAYPTDEAEFGKYMTRREFKGRYANTVEDQRNEEQGLAPLKYQYNKKAYNELQALNEASKAGQLNADNFWSYAPTLKEITDWTQDKAAKAAEAAALGETEKTWSWQGTKADKTDLDIDFLKQLGMDENTGFQSLYDSIRPVQWPAAQTAGEMAAAQAPQSQTAQQERPKDRTIDMWGNQAPGWMPDWLVSCIQMGKNPSGNRTIDAYGTQAPDWMPDWIVEVAKMGRRMSGVAAAPFTVSGALVKEGEAALQSAIYKTPYKWGLTLDKDEIIKSDKNYADLAKTNIRESVKRGLDPFMLAGASEDNSLGAAFVDFLDKNPAANTAFNFLGEAAIDPSNYVPEGWLAKVAALAKAGKADDALRALKGLSQAQDAEAGLIRGADTAADAARAAAQREFSFAKPQAAAKMPDFYGTDTGVTLMPGQRKPLELPAGNAGGDTAGRYGRLQTGEDMLRPVTETEVPGVGDFTITQQSGELTPLRAALLDNFMQNPAGRRQVQDTLDGLEASLRQDIDDVTDLIANYEKKGVTIVNNPDGGITQRFSENNVRYQDWFKRRGDMQNLYAASPDLNATARFIMPQSFITTRMKASARAGLDAVTGSRLKLAERLANALGKKAEVVEGIADGAGKAVEVVNDIGSGRLLILAGPEGRNAINQIAVRGLGDALDASDDMPAFQKAVLNSIPEEELTAARSKYNGLYHTRYSGAELESVVNREAALEWAGNNLFDNEIAVRRFAASNPELVSKVRQFNHGLIAKLEGAERMQGVREQIKQVNGMWGRAEKAERINEKKVFQDNKSIGIENVAGEAERHKSILASKEGKIAVNEEYTIIRAYRDVNIESIQKQYRADPKLIVEMVFKGKGKSGTNAAGWERDYVKYFTVMLDKHPEYWSAKNVDRIENELIPIADDIFLSNFPQYENFVGDNLCHHHIGGGGQAVAVPESLHKGFGGIHKYEKIFGIWDNDIPITMINEGR